MAASSKAQLLTEIQSLLAKRYALEARPGRMTVLEAVIYAICHEGTTREQANQALGRFKDQFFDWNEIRVSTVAEIQDALAGLPDAEEKAKRLRRFLRQLFSRTYRFELDALLKKPLKDSMKSLREYEALNSDYVLATTVQLALGGHAMGVDAPLRRCLSRLDAIKPTMDDSSIRSMMERAIAKNRGAEFVDLIAELGQDTCVDGEPECPRCCLLKICVTGKERAAAAKVAEAAAKAKAKSKAKEAEKEKSKEAETAKVKETEKAKEKEKGKPGSARTGPASPAPPTVKQTPPPPPSRSSRKPPRAK